MSAPADWSSTSLARALGTGRRLAGSPESPLVAAGLLGLSAMMEVLLRADYIGDDGSDVPLGLLLGWGATVPLALVRGHLTIAAIAVTLANSLALASGHAPTWAGMITQLVVLHLLGRRRSWPVSALIVALLLVNTLTAVVWLGSAAADQCAPGFAPCTPAEAGSRLVVVALLSLSVVAVGLGRARWVRSAVAERDATQRAIADSMLEHAARGERARIARELHDVVAHHISMIAVQAETARLTTAGMPAEGASRLLTIGDTARAALTEMRRLLGVLREDAEAQPTRAPQPGLGQLNELIDEARTLSRASTRLIVRGQVAPLDPGIELTAYRIVQEALTNARRHAPGCAVDVLLEYREAALHLRVRDAGPGPATERRHAGQAATAATGHGLLGMRERAAAAGGTLSVGPAPSCGFLVEVTLPRAAG